MKKSRHTLGIFGAGQLALMLSEAARKLGIQTVVLAAKSDDPAVGVADQVVYAVPELVSRSTIVVYENEFIDCRQVQSIVGSDAARFVPALSTLESMGNKLEQKRTFVRLGIPTARFDAYEGLGTVEDWIGKLGRTLGPSFVVKWAKQGYDGKGTCVAQATDTRAAIDFAKRAVDRGIEVYAEEKISFLRELALLTVHSVTGELATYPLVQSEQLRGICKWVEGPLTGVTRLEAEACAHAERIAHDQRLHGVFAIEWFETPDGTLLANELAPRVHNSGHFSQDASRASQFENHCRAALGLPLGSTTSAQAFGMLNLLAPALKKPHELGENFKFPLVPEGVHFHWYGKRQLTPDRKIGHLNSAANSREELAELKLKMLEFESALNHAILDEAEGELNV